MTPKITQEMREALQQRQGHPIEVEDDQTKKFYVLVAREEFRREGGNAAVDAQQLKAAILSRRDESRELNADWECADREVWDADSPSNT